ncbi:MAG: DNA polymerase III subunit delta' [Dehalococcoidia bacterium]
MWQVIGQDKILALLGHSLKEDNIAHAYLLVGPRHVGKRTLALNLAQALNCDDPEPPCSQCHSCHRILEGKHADVTSLSLDYQVEIGIDDIRGLQRLANLPPYEGKCKVFIIDEAEYLSTEAANSLLKILEEPPPKVVWLLLAAEERRLLPTIISRCQRLELKPMPSKQIQQILTDSYNVDLDKAKLLARLCHGCLGWALSSLADNELLHQRSQKIDKLASLLTASLEQRFAYAQELAIHFNQDRRSIMEVMDTWLNWWHDLMLIKGSYKEAITNVDYKVILEKQANEMSLKEIKDFTANLCLTEEDISRNVNARLAFESLMLNMPKIVSYQAKRNKSNG